MTCSCYTTEPKQCNDDVRPKRLIQSQKKSSYWQVRHKTGAIETILQPCCSEPPHDAKQESSNVSICGAIPDGVMKTTRKIKFGNETSASRYHKNCLNSRPTKPKRIRNSTNLRRNITTDSCVDCGACAKKKCGKFKNECYCIRPLNKPKIPGGPECTIPAPNDDDSLLRHCDSSSYAYRPETLQMAKDIIDYVPQSAFLSRMYRENCKKCMCNACVLKAAGGNLKFSERRMNLEKAYHRLAECNRINFDKLSELNCVNISGLNISPKNSCTSSPSPSKSAISDDDCCVRRSCSRNTDEKINAVKCIRKDNFFETHSTNNTCMLECKANQEEHKCIFKYTIDDRGLLAPLNPDAYGTNRCSICNKAQPEESPDYKKRKEDDKETQKTNKKSKNNKLTTKRPPTPAVPPPTKPSKNKNTQNTKEVKEVKEVAPKTQKPSKITKVYCAAQQPAFPQYVPRPLKERPPPIIPSCQPHEIPLKVCNPSPEKTIELNLKNPFTYEEKNVPKYVPKYMTPANSWALRYQKGCSA